MSLKIVFFSTLLVCLLTAPSMAQTNALSTQDVSTVKIDNLPDAEIKIYMQKAFQNGLTESDVYKLLSEKGLPNDEIKKLTQRVEAIKSGQGEVTEAPGNQNNEKNSIRYNESEFKIPSTKNISDLTVFGSALFSSNSLVFEPNLRIPAPSGYILGPDDEIIINVFGYSEKSYTVKINEEGNIYIPQVGPINVSGLSLEQAGNKIRSKLAATIYKAVRNGSTQVQISLGKIKSIRVTVIGEAKKPGNYTVSSLTTVFNVLFLCGGPTDLGSYRKIQLIRGNEIKRQIDLYDFLVKGNQKDNVFLEEGDVIRIPFYDTRVILKGGVKHQGKYELIKGESFEKMLEYSGGFSDDAYKLAVSVYQYGENEKKIVDLPKPKFANFLPGAGDSIVIGKINERFANKVSIVGAVVRPGDFELTTDLTLKELIEKAGGVRDDVYKKRGSISRISETSLPVQLAFNIDSVLSGETVLELKKYDSVLLYSVLDINNKQTVIIDGNVKKPGEYLWAENISLRDLILKAGGINDMGDGKNIEIARRISNLNLKEVNHLQTEIISIDLTDSNSGKDILLKPFDVVNIRQRPDYANQRIVFVEGMVVNPGRYTLQMSSDRVSDVIKRAGGFKANADTTALVIRRLLKKGQTVDDREKIFAKLLNIKNDSLASTERIKSEIYKEYDKISIDLTKALHEKRDTDNMLLEDGDILSIEQNTNLVKVSGEVYYPTIIPFKKGENLKYYIQKSGSYTDLAQKKGTLVVYPDGKAKKVKHFLFFKTYPEVVSRSEIFVPQKNNENKSRMSVAEWSVVLSSLAIVANVIINLSK